MDSEEILTLSVIDLSRVTPVMEAMGRLMERTALNGDFSRAAFRDLATRRANTKTFGEGSPRDNYADMVDIGDMAIQLSDLYPKEAGDVLHALKNCVVYNRHNSDVELYGLSTFYIYGGKSIGEPSLQTYSDLQMDNDYTEYLFNFFDGLLGAGRRFTSPQFPSTHLEEENLHIEAALWQPKEENIFRLVGLLQTDEVNDDFYWAFLGDNPVAFFPITSAMNIRLYAIPVVVNGKDADIIVLFSPRHFGGKVLGIRHRSGSVIQKGHDPINENDEIAVFYLEKNFLTGEENWKKGEKFTLNTPVTLEWLTAPDGFKFGLRHTDVYFDTYYTPPS